MPSGKKHITINWLILAILNILIFIFYSDISIKHYVFFNISFLLVSYYISPDLDIDSSVYRRWGIMRWIWYPYREVMKHQGASHSFIWGPISIILNLLIFLSIIILIAASLDLLTEIPLLNIILEIGAILIICIAIVTWIHIIADKIFNKKK
jgi:uncharacterized metal-binding protein